ncbi:MAG TPA: helix-turn-helix domain-containing protein [Thermomicrobiales bacterium]|nr:helix-turn-helix domain-containing protein [Thermomicrobiales bacterium]
MLSQSGVITEEHLDFTGSDNRRFVDVGARVRSGSRMSELLADVERQALSEALNQTEGDRVAASSLLGMNVSEFQERLSTFGL